MPSLPSFSPYAAGAPRAVAGSVVGLLGSLEGSVAVSEAGAVPGSPAHWFVKLAWTAGDRVVDIDAFGPESPRQYWFRTAHAAWAYRADLDPFADVDWARRLNDLRRHVEATDRPDSDAGRALSAAAASFAVTAGIDDASFRAVVGSPDAPSAVFWLGTRCDQDCGQCWQSRTAAEPPASVFERWLDEALDAGVRSVTFSGGEPTLRPDLPAFVSRARARGATVVLETNGMSLADVGRRKALQSLGIGCFSVSLHAADAALSDALSRTPGAFDRTLAGLRGLVADGAAVVIHTLVDRRNASDLEALASLVAALHEARPHGTPGIGSVSYSSPIRAFDAATHARELPTLDEVRGPLTRALAILKAAGIRGEWCSQAGFAACAVDDPAEVRRALPPPFSDRQDRTLAPVCSSCDVAARCPGVHRFFLERHGAASLRPMRLGAA